jgi:hypothetical protein
MKVLSSLSPLPLQAMFVVSAVVGNYTIRSFFSSTDLLFRLLNYAMPIFEEINYPIGYLKTT